ncbi:hypothetical protein PR003_g20221 [Phytophthora rubi]|uniref:Uncharacterized protein n=1 Tax=Phytophthora rubi TaxID=129364 RepID=A0A6A4DQ37_9STRA|nr:hypothetical protein PR001_g26941 [Phytophthora rubi]KAE8995712.1 hypothetical protein PR002_g19530 [Phytophthora rubi]KAE9310633.1 hypothetical protein PR003_g20221 [Phytophthora rubi]
MPRFTYIRLLWQLATLLLNQRTRPHFWQEFAVCAWKNATSGTSLIENHCICK